MTSQAPDASWSLTATVKPSPGAPDPAPDEDPTLRTPREWAKGADAVRTTVKWLVTALAGVGALLFAKGFVTTPQISWQEHPIQLAIAFLAGVGGLVGVGWLIAMAVDTLRPQMYELNRLPADFLAEVEGAGPGVALPDDCATVEALRIRLGAVRRATFLNGEDIVAAKTSLAAKKPPAGAQAALDDLEGERRLLLHNLAVYRDARTDLLDRAEYFTLSRGLSETRTRQMIGAGVLAAMGGIGYLLALSTAEETAAAVTPVVGEMVRVDSEAGTRLWSLLDLESCQAAADSARVPVVVGAGNGSVDSPYTVTTLPTATCRAQTFTVTTGAALVSTPKSLKITYDPAG